MEPVKLRGHHLGGIYDVVAGCLGEVSDKHALDRSVVDFLDRHCRRGYPIGTVENLLKILEDIFAGKRTVLIVAGPDDVCLGGCIQKSREDLMATKSLCIREDLLSKIESCESDIDFRADSEMLEVFGAEINEEYPAQNLIEKAKELYEEFDEYRWQYLAERWHSARKKKQ